MGHPDQDLLNLILASATREKDGYLAGLARSLAPIPATCAVEQGKPEEVIIEEAAAVSGTLIAMATHGRSGITRWLLGSIAERVLRATASPLLLLGGAKQVVARNPALQAVIVPLDGSELAEAVLPTAIEVAMRLSLKVILARAYEAPTGSDPGSEGLYVPRYYRLKALFQAQAESYLEGKVSEMKELGLSRVSTVSLEGPAAGGILDLARRTPDSLIAMCTHGRSGAQRWLLGSVTEKVVRHSGVPVLVHPALRELRPAPASSGGLWWD
jgi:nucleotide-binding universal stress UspA family protein